MIYIEKLNNTFLQLYGNKGILQEVWDYFSFYVPNHYYMKKFRQGVWDGKIHMFNRRNGTMYHGLLPRLKKFLESRKYEYECDLRLSSNEATQEDVYKFIDSIDLGKLTIRDYQREASSIGIMNSRCILKSPTASGKSLIIYLLIRWYQQTTKKKLLLVVPTISLVDQMYGDFKDYSVNDKWQVDKNCHMVRGGLEKVSDVQVTISTWQSIFRLDREFFEKYEVIIGDEAHGYKAEALSGIMEKSINAPYRIGLTGSLDDSITNKYILEGHFGPVFKIVSSKELMDKGYISNIDIKCLLLEYPDDIRKLAKKAKYQLEIKYITQNPKRNAFIAKLAMSLNENVLILYNFVENHGVPLYTLLRDINIDDRPIHFVHGKTTADEREEIRRIIEKQDNAIILASSGVLSTGVNIKNIQSLIMAHPWKGKIKNLQSIGRSLRLDGKKNRVTIYDIVDNLSYIGRTGVEVHNHTIKHWIKRVEIYNEEEWNYKIIKIPFMVKVRTETTKKKAILPVP